jgi:hypothetical protein
MAPRPSQPAQVIRYSYLWSSEARAGRVDGAKERPCEGRAANPSAAEGRTRRERSSQVYLHPRGESGPENTSGHIQLYDPRSPRTQPPYLIGHAFL